ncbi:hypothetical protein FNU76_15400 [Chitinimonas arctica]|uniref:Uncharacterized protein n=1 Tax=Chitinimonas arctica TaxID=2594795 RepID=A0A516SHJ0_9NEIS|nr:hypothetical protein [Chitinimonas arctica]QDQ27624.1 hypothetical protein FNU76_15400 [Chitinimonas arctica]
MRRKLRIQAASRLREDDEERRILAPAEPLPLGYKYCAVVGILLFWGFFAGWMGPGGRDGMETGFTLFGLCQLPLLWRWLRGQMRRWG